MSVVKKKLDLGIIDWVLPQTSMVRLKDMMPGENKTRVAAAAAARRIINAVNIERKTKVKA